MKKKLQPKKRNSRSLWEKNNRIFENRFRQNEKLRKKFMKRLCLFFLLFILVPVSLAFLSFIYNQF